MDGLELGRPMEGKPRDLSDKTQPVCFGYIHWIYTGKPRDLDSGKPRDLSDKSQWKKILTRHNPLAISNLYRNLDVKEN